MELTTTRNFENLVFEFRGFKVMVDADLATLYETETKKLKQQVKRNQERFPDDFMFELTKEEKERLIEWAPRLGNLKFSSVNPMVFTEQGVSMLSSVLSGPQAVQMNIGIMRAFARYRSFLMENVEIRKEIAALDYKLDEAFQYLLDRLDELSPAIIADRELIGFKTKKE